MQYTEEHYAQMYNELPEGLKDLVLSGRLAILVSAIGSRHGLNADQIADLEPAIEDVCLGLITKEELVENIRKSTGVDQRVANRIAAETELEILKPFDGELIIARKQKENLDEKISGTSVERVHTLQKASSKPLEKIIEPQNVSEHAIIKKVGDWYTKDEQNFKDQDSGNIPATVTNFDWDKDFAKKEEVIIPQEVKEVESIQPKEITPEINSGDRNLETKLDVLTESINKLVNTRFGGEGKNGTGPSDQMSELLKRLEKAEKENEENKRLINNLSGNKNVIQIDKQRKVEIDHSQNLDKKDGNSPFKDEITGNIQITSVSKVVPIEKVVTSSVSRDTMDSIVATRNKVTPTNSNVITETVGKKSLTLAELIAQGDKKVKDAQVFDKNVADGLIPTKTKTLVFPGQYDEKKVDIKNLNQKDSLRSTLLDDLEFLKNIKNDIVEEMPIEQVKEETPKENSQSFSSINTTKTYESNPFKEELIPKTKEERMRILQDKIKDLNKGISVGGKTNLSKSSVDPYRI